MLRQRKESGLSVKEWCREQGLAEVPMSPKPEESHAKLRLTTRIGTLEIMDADRSTLDQVLRMMLHAE